VTQAPLADVSFRFYAQLNAFLDPGRRGRRFTYRLPGPASIKDTIEALGVPHPEVDLILVNGEPVDFAYAVRDGDAVSVYPRFRRIELGDASGRAGDDPPDPVRFVLDVHLGKLASLLRLAGFDAGLLADDAEVAAMGARENRVVLTRDVGLLKRSLIRHGRWIRNTDPELQLAEVLEAFGLVEQMRPFSRCLECNAVLVPADGEAVRATVDPEIRTRFDEFTRCSACGRVYWQGSHHARLSEVLARARRRVRGSGDDH
jgi:uncharacterized protein with PIN domain